MRASNFYSATVVMLVSAVLALSACSPSPPKAPAKTVKAKPIYSADIFVQNLAIARLSLHDGVESTSAAADSLDIIEAYAAQPAAKRRNNKQVILIVDYSIGSDTVRQVVAPLNASGENTDFAALQAIMAKLGETHYVLHDMRLAATRVKPPKLVKLSEKPLSEIRLILDEQQQNVLLKSAPLTPLDDARTQLKLIGFFIESRLRDAAYLAIDNVKKNLAAQSATPANETEVKRLSLELERLEGTLHSAMRAGVIPN